MIQQYVFSSNQNIVILANEAVKNLKLFKRKQSILLTGVSGSGKTENCEHIINFLCRASFSQNVVHSGNILEAFGNARTHRNTNSSRFCKNIEVIFWSTFTHFNSAEFTWNCNFV